jgi:uncharacterized protein YecE (DUF72 family)
VVPDPIRRDDAALARLLDSWPSDVPLALELQHPSWEDDSVHGALRDRGVVLVATDADRDPDPVSLRRTGPFLYLRLRRSGYEDADLDAWAARLSPFLADGIDVFVFFRHDAVADAPLRALALTARLRARTSAELMARSPGRRNLVPR